MDLSPWQVEASGSRTGEAWGEGGCIPPPKPSLEEPALSCPQTPTLTSRVWPLASLDKDLFLLPNRGREEEGQSSPSMGPVLHLLPHRAQATGGGPVSSSRLLHESCTCLSPTHIPRPGGAPHSRLRVPAGDLPLSHTASAHSGTLPEVGHKQDLGCEQRVTALPPPLSSLCPGAGNAGAGGRGELRHQAGTRSGAAAVQLSDGGPAEGAEHHPAAAGAAGTRPGGRGRRGSELEDNWLGISPPVPNCGVGGPPRGERRLSASPTGSNRLQTRGGGGEACRSHWGAWPAALRIRKAVCYLHLWSQRGNQAVPAEPPSLAQAYVALSGGPPIPGGALASP